MMQEYQKSEIFLAQYGFYSYVCRRYGIYVSYRQDALPRATTFKTAADTCDKNKTNIHQYIVSLIK